jgi:hypothetical protein
MPSIFWAFFAVRYTLEERSLHDAGCDVPLRIFILKVRTYS